jgi:hypothetical protein
MRRLLAFLTAALAAMTPVHAYAATVAWEPGKTVAGIFDVDGPRSDGSLIVAGAAALYLMNPAGAINPFARGPGGYREDKGAEAYLANSPGGKVSSANCSFGRDETYLLRLHIPIGVEKVSASGEETGSFANLTGASTLNGIAFDTTGAFDHRLLVSGPSKGKTVIFAVDCNGDSKVITRSAPRVEGGLAVAPSTFGSFGGALIATDELSGKIYAIKPTGAVSIVAQPKLPIGTDTGVGPHGSMGEEFLVMHELGMEPLQCLQSATTVAARTIGYPGVGSLQPGDWADVIGVPGDPLANLELVARPDNVQLVVKGGTVVKDSRN